MKIDKQEIIANHCYTPLVYNRINKKLGVNYSKAESENHILKVFNETSIEDYEKIGKNFYVTSKKFNIKITINSDTFRIITVDKVIK